MKTLVLIRHAKSSWKHHELKDYQRPLNGRGRRDAPLMAERFSHLEPKPDLLVSSHAVRAQETAKVFAQDLGYPLERIQLNEQIYEAMSDTLLNIISELPDKHQRVALFGHNPGFTNLVDALTTENIINLPTAGVAVIDLPIKKWEAVKKVAQEQSGKLVYYSYPKLEE
jgi:phosphohistidine phosphatase